MKTFAVLLLFFCKALDCFAQSGRQYEALSNDYHWALNLIDKRSDDAIIHSSIGVISEITGKVNYTKFITTKCKAPSNQRRWSTAQKTACERKIMNLIGGKLAATYPYASSNDVDILCNENPTGCGVNTKFENWFRESHNRNIERLRHTQIEALDAWSSQTNAQIQAGIIEEQNTRRQKIVIALQIAVKNVQSVLTRTPSNER